MNLILKKNMNSRIKNDPFSVFPIYKQILSSILSVCLSVSLSMSLSLSLSLSCKKCEFLRDQQIVI